MVRFYHLDPERLTEIPGWLLGALAEHLPRLRAEEALELASVMLLPHMQGRERRRFLRRLKRTAQPQPAKAPVEMLENDPAKAATWFARQGAKVVYKKYE